MYGNPYFDVLIQGLLCDQFKSEYAYHWAVR